jgi:hypothetical protein
MPPNSTNAADVRENAAAVQFVHVIAADGREKPPKMQKT